MGRKTIIFVLLGIIPVIWIALLFAPYMENGLLDILLNINNINLFSFELVENSLKTVFIFLLIYFLVILYIYSKQKNYRKLAEFGSAKWGTAKEVNKKYRQEPITNNKILTKNVSIGLNGKLHRRNINTIIIGGSGSGKTRFYAKPNIMQCNTSFIVLDPKGEILRDTGNLLKQERYNIKILDLKKKKKSDGYNPFVYLKTDNDVQKLVTNLFKSTTPKGSTTSDPFWDSTASMLLMALVFYLLYEAPEEEQNFSMVLEMLRAGSVNEEDDGGMPSVLDILFENLEMRNPNHIALRYYRDYRIGAGKTLKSILITLASRLDKFNLDSLVRVISKDELDLGSLGEKKTALFALIPDNDPSFNFLVSMLYTQLFQQLFYLADYKYGGSLPIHVHFLMDEFANVSLPNEFAQILSVMRSREVSVSIILQNLSQLKALFEKDWESIVGNCDELLYLGGNEQSTHKFVSEFLGKETININSYVKSAGRNGSNSTNSQLSGRELLTPDEVRMLNNNYAILFIRGEKPIKDKKYNILKHPNVKYTTDGKGKPYIHGLDKIQKDKITNTIINNYEVIYCDEIEEYLERNKEDENEEK